jgi:hypothetical protein
LLLRVGGVPAAIRGAEVVWSIVPGTAAQDTATRGRPGFKGFGRIEPAALEDCVAKPPRIGMRGVGDPGAYARIHVIHVDCPRPPSVTQAAQAVAEPPHLIVREAPVVTIAKDKAEKLSRLPTGQHERLARVNFEAPAAEVALDPRAPVQQGGGVICKQREVVHIAEIRRMQNLGHEIIEAIEVEIGEKLAGSDQGASPPGPCKT